MHLVVDDETPVEGIEKGEVRVLALPLRSENLVRRNRHRAHLLDLPGILSDLLLGQGGALEEFGLPLPGRDGVGNEDERGRLAGGHRAETDQGLARAAGQHDHARAVGGEVVDRLMLVGAQVPRRLVEGDLVRGAGRVTGEVFGGPAEFEQFLLELAAGPGLHDVGVIPALLE